MATVAKLLCPVSSSKAVTNMPVLTAHCVLDHKKQINFYIGVNYFRRKIIYLTKTLNDASFGVK